MAKDTVRGVIHTGDPSKKSGEFDTIADGKYRVNGIEKFISIDDNEMPVFKVQRSGDVSFSDKLKVVFKFRTVDNSEGPACSMTVTEFYALALVFGVELTGVTSKNRMSSEIINSITEKINEKATVLTVESKEGWCNRIPNAVMPEGMYVVEFDRAIGNSNGYGFKAGQYGNYLMFVYKVVSALGGRPTLWEGHELFEFMNDPFVDGYIQEDGSYLTATQMGAPMLQREDRADTTSTELPPETLLAKRWTAFINHFAPKTNEHVWQSDPLKSEFGINELLNPQEVIIKYALEEKAHKTIMYKQFKKRYGFDLMDLDSLNPTDEEEFVGLDDVEEVPFDNGNNVHFQLYNYIHTQWSTIDIFKDDYTFTDEGKDWAKKIMQPVWEAAGLGKKRPLPELTQEEAQKLLNAFQPKVEDTSDGETW